LHYHGKDLNILNFPGSSFVDESKSYPRIQVNSKAHSPRAREIDLSAGVCLEKEFSDSAGLLDTAYCDLSEFFRDVKIPENGSYLIQTMTDKSLAAESFRIKINNHSCSLVASDTEGMRRGIYHLMDKILSGQGRFLKTGTEIICPAVLNRISRSWYAPKNRPPVRRDILMKTPGWQKRVKEDPEYRDELLDDFDYYPEAYLSTLAREGVNGLWITDSFHDICKSKYIPEYGQKADKKLAKLRKVVRKCKRYGIKIYLFCLEPRGFGEHYKSMPMEILEKHPEFRGFGNRFCTSSPLALKYLQESTNFLFSKVPELGGLINLCVGEMGTHCYSGQLIDGGANVDCPHCSKRSPAEVLAEILAAMKSGMNTAAPEAELIAWPYAQYICWGEELTIDAAGKMPDDVLLMHNFESGGRVVQAGKKRTLNDYWLAYAGPSKLFRKCAKAATENNTRIGAKIQAGNSNELTTVPFVPVPGILYKKYKEIRNLNISTVMQCWLIGSCPSLMTKAAGMLSFAPLPASCDKFLKKLAAIYWGQDADQVAEAWKLFEKGYKNYPYSTLFSFISPMNAGVAWPMFLIPRDTPLQPPFRSECPPCGDRIGECLAEGYSLEDAIKQCKKMTLIWDKGMKLLEPLAKKLKGNKDRLRDIAVSRAVGIQLNSCYNILKFYSLREKLAYEKSIRKQRSLLEKLNSIIELEIKNSTAMITLCENDSRLGLHAETGRYLYHPEKLAWRIEQLKELLKEEFTSVKNSLKDGVSPFPEYIGDKPGKDLVSCDEISISSESQSINWESIAKTYCEQEDFSPDADRNLLKGRDTYWRSCFNDKSLFLEIYCEEPDMQSAKQRADCVEVAIEMRRLWPCRRVMVDMNGKKMFIANDNMIGWKVQVLHEDSGWRLRFELPWNWLWDENCPEKPIRINFRRVIAFPDKNEYIGLSWCGFKPYPKKRLLLPDNNPADFGWLILNKN